MLFNSYAFIFLFLPVAFFGFFRLGAARHVYGAAWLAAASLFFYGWWDWVYVPLLGPDRLAELHGTVVRVRERSPRKQLGLGKVLATLWPLE